MDFFQAQDDALARSKWLVGYFAAAVVLIIVAVYLAVTAGVFYYHFEVRSGPAPGLFDLKRLLITGLIVGPMIAMGSFWKISQLRRKGGQGVAEALDGRRVSASSRRPKERQLRNVVEEMAIAAGLPVPGVYVLEREAGINAFAAGFDFDDAVIGITRGALEQFDRDELQGVVAHEFSHILNGDMRLNTALSGWIHGIMMLTLLGRGFWRLIGGGSDRSGRRGGGGVYVGGGGGRSKGGGGDSKGGGAIIIAIILVAVLITIIGFIGEFFAKLIQSAVSRQREFLADASAVQFTRNPEGIGNALRRIGGSTRRARLHHPEAGEFAHSFFANSRKRAVSIWATHPPLETRISKILQDWKGDFLTPRPKPKPAKKESPKKQKRSAQNPFTGAMGSGSGTGSGDFRNMLTAGLFMRCLGQFKANSVERARVIREELEATRPEVYEDTTNSPIFLLALVYDHTASDTAKQDAILSEAFPDWLDAVKSRSAELQDLSRSERLILTEVLADRLPEALVESERPEFIEALEALIQADDKILPFEIACLQIVRRCLLKESHFAPSRQDNEAIIEAASILTSLLLRESTGEHQDAGSILRSASQQAPFFMNLLRTVETRELPAVSDAFSILARTPLGIRKQFLSLCERIVAADQKASIDEVELLRAVAIGIAVPAALILPEAED